MATALQRNNNQCPWPGCEHRPKGKDTKNWQSHLRRHLKIHLGEKVPCTFPGCRKTFAGGRKDNRRAHLLKVHGIGGAPAVETSEVISLAGDSRTEGCSSSSGTVDFAATWEQQEEGLHGLKPRRPSQGVMLDGMNRGVELVDPQAYCGLVPTEDGDDSLQVGVACQRPSDLGPTAWNTPQWS